MEVKIGEDDYVLLVNYQYQEDGENKEQILPLSKWVEMVRKKGVASLYEIEAELSKLFGHEIKLSEDFPHIKRPILNLTGSVERLNNNLILKKLSSDNKKVYRGFFNIEDN